MYIRDFIQLKAWFSILHKSPLLPVFLPQRLISDPVWTQNQHTSLRADAVTSPPISETRAYVCRSSTPAVSSTVRAPNLASSCRDTVSEDDRKSFRCGGGGSSVELPATWSPRWICIGIPTLIWDPPSPHISIFRQEQTATVIRKLSEKVKDCAWISKNAVAAEFSGFQSLSLDYRVGKMIEWVAFAALNPFTNEWGVCFCTHCVRRAWS